MYGSLFIWILWTNCLIWSCFPLQQIGGQEIKANITEKPLQTMDLPFFQSEESEFIDSPHKVYVGNLAKTVTTEMLNYFFAEKGKVLSAKVSRVPGTSKSSGFGFVRRGCRSCNLIRKQCCKFATLFVMKTWFWFFFYIHLSFAGMFPCILRIVFFRPKNI